MFIWYTGHCFHIQCWPGVPRISTVTSLFVHQTALSKWVWCLGVFFKAVFCVHYASVRLHPLSASYSPPQCKKSHLTLTSSCSVHCFGYWRQQCFYIFSNVHFFSPSEIWLASRTCNFRVTWPLNGLSGWHRLTLCNETCTRISLKHHWIPGISYLSAVISLERQLCTNSRLTWTLWTLFENTCILSLNISWLFFFLT